MAPPSQQQEFYTRRLLGTYLWYVGIFFLGIAAILLLTGSIGGFLRVLLFAILASLIGRFNRKPGVNIGSDSVTLRMWPHTNTYRLVDIQDVQTKDGRIVLVLKDGRKISVPYREYSRTTRQRMAIAFEDVHRKMMV
ncbi:MAG: hypothetical protein AAB932_03275 [Patescibacteria group bacterium]